MQAIQTRYIGGSNTRISRMQAKTATRKILVRYDHNLTTEGNHEAVALRLYADLMQIDHWPCITDGTHRLHGACFDGNWYWSPVRQG